MRKSIALDADGAGAAASPDAAGFGEDEEEEDMAAAARRRRSWEGGLRHPSCREQAESGRALCGRRGGGEIYARGLLRLSRGSCGRDGVPIGEAPAVLREHVRVLPRAAPELPPPRQALQEAARRDIPQDARWCSE